MNDYEKYVEEFMKDIPFEDARSEHRDALKARLLNAFPGRRFQPAKRSIWRAMMRTPITKLATAAAIAVIALVVWRMTEGISQGYTLSDVPRLMEQAKTIHVRMRYFNGEEGVSHEYWCDLMDGRMCRYWERPAPEMGPQGWQTVMNPTQTVWDGQYVMEVNHRTKTARFERLLVSQRQSNRLLIAESALKMTLQDIGNLGKYTRVDAGEIDGRRYDIWQREFKLTNAKGFRIRYEYWISPTTGVVGRMRERRKYEQNQEWQLAMETDSVEIDAESPAGLFSTEPPAGYTVENQKAAAEVSGIGFPTFHSVQGHVLRAPVSFTLKDGSILVCWRGTHDSIGSGPDALYEHLDFGGDLPQAPAELLAMMSSPDKDNPGPMMYYAGRHLAVTRTAGRIYEWALYVPQYPIAADGVTDFVIAAVRLNTPDPATWVRAQLTEDPALRPNQMGHETMKMRTWGFTSLRVTAETFAQYVPPALHELSDDQTVPREMTYEGLLTLADRVRATPELYERVREQVTETQERVAVLEPVEITTPEQAAQQAKRLVEIFYAAIVDGRDADAVKMLRYEEPRASRVVTGMKQLPGVREIKVEDIYATGENALVVTNEFPVDEGRSGRWAISVIKEKGTWLIKDFDATTTDRMGEEVDKYLQPFPDAKHFSE
jgi:hypothetical protein